MDFRKTLLRSLFLGIGAGIAMMVVQKTTNLDPGYIFRVFVALIMFVVFSCIVFNYIYTLSYQRKMKAAADLLSEGKADEYIEAVEKLYHRAKGRFLKRVLRLNLSAGYCEKRDYENAALLLEDMEKDRLDGQMEMVRRLNLCISYFHTQRADEALALYRDSKVIFDAFRTNPYYENSFAIVDCLAAIAELRIDDAKELLAFAKETDPDPRHEEDFRSIERLIAVVEGKEPSNEA